MHGSTRPCCSWCPLNRGRFRHQQKVKWQEDHGSDKSGIDDDELIERRQLIQSMRDSPSGSSAELQPPAAKAINNPMAKEGFDFHRFVAPAFDPQPGRLPNHKFEVQAKAVAKFFPGQDTVTDLEIVNMLNEKAHKASVRHSVHELIRADEQKYKCRFGDKVVTLNLWEVFMVWAGTYEHHNAFAETLTLKSPDHVVKLGLKLGADYFTHRSLQYCVYRCGLLCFRPGSNKTNAALCGRELLVTAMWDAIQTPAHQQSLKVTLEHGYQEFFKLTHYVDDQLKSNNEKSR